MNIFPKIGLIVLTVFSIALCTSCLKKDEYPEIPEIAFKDFSLVDSTNAVLTITFTDGDGDIGNSEKKDTLSPDPSNLFLKYSEKENGVFVEQDLQPPFNYQMPVLKKTDKNKALSGEVLILIEGFYFNPTTPADTFRYEIFIKDRAGHESNRVFTNELVKPQ